MTRKTWAIALGILIVVAASAFLVRPSCRVRRAMAKSYLTPDAKWSVTVYEKTCSTRLSRNSRSYWAVALRPAGETAAQADTYNESEIVFEVSKGTPAVQVGITAPSVIARFSYLPDSEREHSFLVMCYPNCPAERIRRQIRVWHGIPVHYFVQERPNAQPMIE